jgi:hypothetical protein
MILKRGFQAKDYYTYCEEVGCDVWSELTEIKDALYEPAGFWLPASLQLPSTSEYVQGVEVPVDYSGPIPEGYDRIELQPCLVMVFQGPPFKDEDYEAGHWLALDIMATMIRACMDLPGPIDEAPRFQLEPQGYRGYIEGRPVRRV